MTRKVVTEVLKTCGRLVGHARGAGSMVAAAVSGRYGGRRPGRRGSLGVGELQLALADELAAMQARLVAWDDRCAREVERGRRLRRRRERLQAELRSTLRRLKSSFSGAFDGPTARYLLGPVRRLGGSPAEILEQAERLHATLTDPAVELPPPGPGLEIDLVLAADSFQRPMAGLGETLAELPECESAERHARSRKGEELERLALFAERVARFYSALCELAGHERVAQGLGC